MKRFTAFLILLALALCLLAGCSQETPQVVATTAPVCEFTRSICEGSGISVGQLVTEEVSCLHDYSLQVSQMQMLESAELIVISGAGLEDFLVDVLPADSRIIDSSAGCHIHGSNHIHEHDGHEDHHHQSDPHIWLAPENARIMAQNIAEGLTGQYPEHANIFEANLEKLLAQLDALQTYGEQVLANLSQRELITFHDGFAYFAEAFDLTILRAIEEESGSEASAQELKELILLVQEYDLPALFTEVNGSTSAARTVATEAGATLYSLSMAMSGGSYFEIMYHNIDTVKEALE